MVGRALSATSLLKAVLLLSTSNLLAANGQALNHPDGNSFGVTGFPLNRRALSPNSAVPLSSTPAVPSSSTPAVTNQQSASTANSTSLNTNNAECVPPPLTNVTWINLGIDNYLANLPNGTKINLQEFATSVGAADFICGVGEKCNAGQLCGPVRTPSWEVLVAAQEWNNFQNKLYTAVGTAVQIVTAVSAALVSDLYPPAHSGHLWDIMHTFTLASAIAAGIIVVAEVGMFITGGPVMALASYFVVGAAVSLAVTMGVAGGVGLKLALQGREPTAFERWADYAFYLSEWQQHVQKDIANSTRSVVNAGVSTPQGISTVLKNGTFFYETPTINEAEVIAGLKNTTTARMVVDILRNQNAFVTIASDKCTNSGPGGAWAGKDKLSYCSSNGTMMNIIHGHKKKVNNKWFNANLIELKYGISVQYIAEQSFNCQMKHGSFGFDPYKSGAFPNKMDAECIANLPVCDFRNKAIADVKKEKNTMVACRTVGKLPI